MLRHSAAWEGENGRPHRPAQRQQVTEDDFRDLKAFGLMARDQLEEFGDGFDFREFIINELDVKATLSVEDGQRIIYVTCLGRPRGETFSLMSPRSHVTEWRIRRRDR
jgi:hypothetical protein